MDDRCKLINNEYLSLQRNRQSKKHTLPVSFFITQKNNYTNVQTTITNYSFIPANHSFDKITFRSTLTFVMYSKK